MLGINHVTQIIQIKEVEPALFELFDREIDDLLKTHNRMEINTRGAYPGTVQNAYTVLA